MPAPANDTRAAAQLLTGTTGTTSGTTVDATPETGTVYEFGTWQDVWFYWATLAAGVISVSYDAADPTAAVEYSLWAEAPAGAAGDYGDPEHLDFTYDSPGTLTVFHPGGPLTLAVATTGGDETAFDLSWVWVEGAEASMVGTGEMSAETVLTSGPAEAVMVGASFMAAISPAKGRRWRAVVVDVNGTPLCELPDALIGPISYTLNEPESWSIALLQNDPAAAYLVVPFQEVQVWRGDQLLAWGPCVRWAYDQDTFVAYFRGAMWHLTRRYIGKANRHNWVTNGGFEDGVDGWNPITSSIANYWGWDGAQPDPPAYESVLTPKVEGRRAMRLQNSVPGADAWLNQAFAFTVDPSYSPEGDTFTLKGYVYLTATIPPGAGALENRGLYLERFSSTQQDPRPEVQEAMPGAPLSLEHTFVALDEDTPVGVWTRFEVEFVTPPKAGEYEGINVRLYAPAGIDVYWDAVSLTLIEKLAFYNTDQAQIVQGIVEHLQDADYDKSDVNISTSCPPTGIIRTRVYVHSEHPPGWRAIQEFNDLDDGMDYRMVYTATDRVFTTHFPRLGALKTAYALVMPTADVPGNIATWSYSFDGEQASSSVIVLGTGNGSDREEGGAVDTSAWANDVTMEEVFVSPDQTPIDSLAAMAAERLVIGRNPYSLKVTVTPPNDSPLPDPVGNLWPGDTVPVTIPRHALDIDGAYRVVGCVIDPRGSMTLDLNLRVES